MTQRQIFNIETADSSWHECLYQGLKKLDSAYLEQLYRDTHWLPGPQKIFNAFSLPVEATHYVLFGESPYPRVQSANGYAFWDAAVQDIWSSTGLSKPVNRATSLRNIIKMLLVAAGRLAPDKTSQPEIAKLDKSQLVQTNQEFFGQLLNHGFLLLNATLILQPDQVRQDAVKWQPFIHYVLTFLIQQNPSIQLILFGNIANLIDKLVENSRIKKLYAEHPYNLSFINNPDVLNFFRPLSLLISNLSYG